MSKKSKLPILKKFYIYSLEEIYILNILLLPFSVIYLLVNFIKQNIFINKKRNTVPVIVVGNLTVGGTGKTSLVIWLANYLNSRKYNIGVISGGYKTNEPYKIEIVDENSTPNNVGDEAILIANKTNAIVCKSKNRKSAYEHLVKNYSLDIIISDDGLTHYNRNLKIFGVAMTMVDARSKLSRHVCDQVNTKMPKKLFKTTIRRLVKVAEAPWSGAPTVLLNKPTNSGAGAGSLEYWTLAKEFHQRVMAMRREFGVNEQPRLLLDRNR